MPRCAILIVNFNSWDYLSRCLKSLSQQTYQNFKVLVADNASEQIPPPELCSILPEIDIIQNDTNEGFASANNHLLQKVKNMEWVILLNPDAFPEEDWLEQLMKAANEYSEFSSFSSRLYSAENPELIDGEGDCYHISGLAWRNKHGEIAGNNLLPKEIFSPCAAAAMYRTERLLEAGGFDDDFFCYFEDVDLGFRMRLAGNRCLLVPSAKVSHIGSITSGGRRSNFSVYHGHRNLVWTYVKNMPGGLFWFFLPLHIILNLLSLIWFTARRQGNVIFRAKMDALRKFPVMWRKRRSIQKYRVISCMELMRLMDKRLFLRKRGG